MIEAAAAVRFDRVATKGRNSPLLVAVETSDGAEHEVFLKLTGQSMGIEQLANEALAACLAADGLGLPVPKPYLVSWDAAFAAAVPDLSVQARLRNSAQPGFGSTAAGTGWQAWSRSTRLPIASQPDMLAIMAFDAFIGNYDRCVANPNCLVKGDKLRLIDHEAAFTLQFTIPRYQPWAVGGLSRMVTGDSEHIFAARLRGSGVSSAAVEAAWRALTDAQLRSYVDGLPASWTSASTAMNVALTHLTQVRDRIGDCLAELQRVLS